MALQIRRGTNKERLQITPAEGELIYVTDYELVTISATALNATTNVLTSVAHGLTTNQQIRFQDTSKNGLTLNQVYYVASTPDPDTFTLKVSLAGAVVDITGTYTTPLVFATTPTNAAGAPLGINVTALWIGDGNTVGGVPGNTQGLDDLTDVQITTPIEGNTLYYDATTKQWKNTNILNIDDVTGTQNITVNATDVSNFIRTNTNTSSPAYVANFFSKTTNTPTNGFGSAITFSANNTAGTERRMGAINIDYDSITPNSENGELTIGLIENGTLPSNEHPAALRLRSNGNLYVKGDLTLGVPDILAGTLGVANLYNHTPGPDTINIGNGVVTEVNIGNAAGSRVQIKSPTIVGATASMDVFNTVAQTVNAFGAATTLSIGSNAPGATTTFNKNVVIAGDLTINGSTTTVNTATMTVDDPNLVLNAVGSPTDTNANGGGITVNGTTNKSLFWNNADKRWYFDNGTGGQVDGANKMVVDLTDIRSVETTAFNKGQMFFYDGTNWINGNNIKFDNATYRPILTTQANVDTNGNPSPGGVNTALRLVKDTTTSTFTDGAGTGIILSVDSDSQDRIDVGRLHAQYDAGGAHDVSLLTTTTNNDTIIDLIRSSKDRTSINNGKIYVNAENSRIGINTITPNTTLDVAGNAYISSTLEVAATMTARADVNVGGETITMNYGFTGVPGQDVGIVVERGNETDAYWKWIEGIDSWKTGNSIFADGEIVAQGVVATNGQLIIFNNDNATPAGTDHALLRVKRGGTGSTDVFFRWNETSDRWDFTNNGSTYTNIPVATDTPTYVGLNTTTGDINVNNKTYLYGNSGDIKAGGDIYADGNNLTFNYAQTGSPDTGTAGLIVERGDLANTQLRWNNGNLRWESTVDGSAYISLPNQTLDTFSSPTFSSLQANAHLTVLGDANLGSGAEDTIRMNGLVANNITFSYNDSATPRGILGQMSNGAVDYWFVGGAESGGTLNAGELLLATGDDGTDPIRVRQYTGSPLSGTIARELTLLDGSGNTTLPGILYANTISSTAGALQLTSPNTQHIKLTPGTTGNVYLESSTIGFGDTSGSLGATLTTNNPGPLRLDTENGANSSFINIANGLNGDITLDTSGTGKVIVNAAVDVNNGIDAQYLILDDLAGFDTATATTTATATIPLTGTGRKVFKSIITAATANDTQVVEVMIMRDANDVNGAQIAVYGELRTGASLATYTADYDNGLIRLLVTPASTTSTTFNIVRTSLS